MLGHEIRLSQTNTYGWVPLCGCGWIGSVTRASGAAKGRTERSHRIAELTKSVAAAQHAAHVESVRADIESRSERELASIGTRISLANDVLQRRGRWGHS